MQIFLIPIEFLCLQLQIKAVRVFAGLLLTTGLIGIVGVGLIAFQLAPPFIAVAFATLKLTAHTALIGTVILKVSGISLALLFKAEEAGTAEETGIPTPPPIPDSPIIKARHSDSSSTESSQRKKPKDVIKEEDLKKQVGVPTESAIAAQKAAMTAKAEKRKQQEEVERKKKEEEAEVERQKNQEGDSKTKQEQQPNRSGPKKNPGSSEHQPPPWAKAQLKKTQPKSQPSEPDKEIAGENGSHFSGASNGPVSYGPKASNNSPQKTQISRQASSQISFVLKKVGQASAQQQAPQEPDSLTIILQQRQEKIKKQEEELKAQELAAVAQRQAKAEEQARQEQEQQAREAEEQQQAEEKTKEEARILAEKTAEDKRKKEEQEAARHAAEEQRLKAQFAQLQGASQVPALQIPESERSSQPKILSEKMRLLQAQLIQPQDESNSPPPLVVSSEPAADQSPASPASLLGNDGIPEAPPLPGISLEADQKLKSALKKSDKLSHKKHVDFSVPLPQPSASSPVYSQPESPSEDALEGDAKTRAAAQLPPESFVTPKKSSLKKQIEELEALEQVKAMYQGKKKKGGLTESVYGKLQIKFHGEGADNAAQAGEESDEEEAVSDISDAD